MLKTLKACLLCAFATLACVSVAAAQDAKDTGPKSSSENRFNRGTVSLIAGDINSTTIRMSQDLGVVLNDGEKLRVIPVAGKGSLQNLLDVLYLDGIDVGLVQADVLEHARSKELHPNLDSVIRYVAKLHNEEVHLLVRKDIGSFGDLANKPVNVGPPGSGSFVTASALFGALDIPIKALNHDLDLALEFLKSGEIAGLVYVAGKPARIFNRLSEEDGIKLMPLPKAPQLWQSYLPARFTAADYPVLIAPGQTVETVAVGTVMVVYNWSSDSSRHGKVRRFVETFFERIDDFQSPGRHAKWSEVNLAAEVTGWRRFAPADDWLKAHSVKVAQSDEAEAASPDAELELAFERFLRQNPIGEAEAAKGTESENVEALFQQFLKWSGETRQ